MNDTNALAALRALHAPRELLDGRIICTHCTPDDWDDAVNDPTTWPCPSIRVVTDALTAGV